jgi:MGT family glycosyltransferase
MSASAIQTLPGSPLVVNYAPQLELLARANLTITHAGLNTVLDSLSNGVPMIAIPITYEQPAIAARIRWTNTGEVISLQSLTVPKLRALVQQLLMTDTYTNNAQKLKVSMQQAGGVKRAADIIEQVITTGYPVAPDWQKQH